MHILLVEDDDQIADAIERGLQLHDFAVNRVATGAAAKQALISFSSDLIILDLGLPDVDGMQVLTHWRAQGMQLPVLVLTARDGLQDKVSGLQAGADDYVLKPFELDELIARVHALIRRSSGLSAPLIRHGAVDFNPSTREVRLHGKVIFLSRRELALMEKLLYSGRRIISTEQLYDSLYGYGEEPDSNSLSVHIYHVRQKLGKDIIETVRGLGYRLGKVSTGAVK